MDLLEFLRIMFPCLKPKRKKNMSVPRRFSSFDKVSSVRRKPVGRRHNMDANQRIIFVRTRANYTDRKKVIMSAITFDRSRGFFLWCPQNAVPNDYIRTELCRYGEIRNILDKWVRRGHSVGPAAWAGAVVEYEESRNAMVALKEIPMRCSHIKAIAFSDLLSLLVDCELMKSAPEDTSSTLMIYGRIRLENAEANNLLLDLGTYGRIDQLFLDNRGYSRNVLCKVTYPYLTQAYLAMMMTGGRQCRNGLISSELAENSRDEEILEDAKACLMMTMGSFFP